MTDPGACLSLEDRSAWGEGFECILHSGSTLWWPAEEEEGTDSLDLELHLAVRCLVFTLRTKLKSSDREVLHRNHETLYRVLGWKFEAKFRLLLCPLF